MPKLTLPEDTAPRVQIRFRQSGGHHASSGAWKVAYADFVTALMALFIVLWLMNSSTKVKASISGYFRDPRGFTRTQGAGPGSAGEGLVIDHHNVDAVRKQLESALRAMPEFGKLRDNVKFSVTGEGLRIDLLENDQGMFFVSGSAAPTAAGEELLRVLAHEIGGLPNPVVIEGHTDASPYRRSSPAEGYSNWELAADRANAARRLLHTYGVRPEQVVEVRGYADQKPFNEKNRFDARNRRVSVVVKFVTA